MNLFDLYNPPATKTSVFENKEWAGCPLNLMGFAHGDHRCYNLQKPFWGLRAIPEDIKEKALCYSAKGFEGIVQLKKKEFWGQLEESFHTSMEYQEIQVLEDSEEFRVIQVERSTLSTNFKYIKSLLIQATPACEIYKPNCVTGKKDKPAFVKRVEGAEAPDVQGMKWPPRDEDCRALQAVPKTAIDIWGNEFPVGLVQGNKHAWKAILA